MCSTMEEAAGKGDWGAGGRAIYSTQAVVTCRAAPERDKSGGKKKKLGKGRGGGGRAEGSFEKFRSVVFPHAIRRRGKGSW